ncbi:MAG: flagellar protein FlaG [Selenomonadaceae bacterium]|nr:flagellar protein FlaG [Selenomonadaceae bacterium]
MAVEKLNDMFAAAMIAYSASKTSNSSSSQAQADSKSSTEKVNNVQDVQMTKDEEQDKKEQEEHLELGTMTEESVNEMLDTFNKLMEKINCNIEFSYNKEADVLNVKMIDKETKEVIKEFPPEEMIENMIKAKDWLGAFIDRAI